MTPPRGPSFRVQKERESSGTVFRCVSVSLDCATLPLDEIRALDATLLKLRVESMQGCRGSSHERDFLFLNLEIKLSSLIHAPTFSVRDGGSANETTLRLP